MATPPKPTAAPPSAAADSTAERAVTPAANPAAEPAAEPAPSLIEYPSAFPIKVMGMQVPGFEAAMVAIARQFDPAFDDTTVERRPSKAGTYLGLTLTVIATSREQLDGLYRTLSTHPMVKVVL